jgi:hypothetical protein
MATLFEKGSSVPVASGLVAEEVDPNLTPKINLDSNH